MLSRVIIENLNHDYSTLESEDDYAKYHDYLYVVTTIWLQQLDRLLVGDRIIQQELAMIALWTKRFLSTIQALRMKYLYPLNYYQKMYIDMSNSCFPNLSEIKELNTDMMVNRTSTSKKRSYREILLDMESDLISGKDVTRSLLEEMGLNRFNDMLHDFSILERFTKLGIIKKDGGMGYKIYFAAWSAYDAFLNRPVLFFMEFEYHYAGLDLTNEHENVLWEILRVHDSVIHPMKKVAAHIDSKLEYIKPLKLKRIDLGPIIGQYSKDLDDFTSFIKSYDNEFVINCVVEVIYAKKVKRTLSTPDKIRQVFFVPKHTSETAINETSERHTYLFCSHMMAQNIKDSRKFDDLLKSLALAPITFSNSKIDKIKKIYE